MNECTQAVDMKYLRNLLERIPADLVDVHYDENDYECNVNVVPKGETCCPFWVGISSYGTYGLCFGRGLSFEDISSKEVPLIEVVQAILNGNVRESEYRSFGFVTKIKGEIFVNDKITLTDTRFYIMGFLNFLGSNSSQRKYDEYPRR